MKKLEEIVRPRDEYGFLTNTQFKHHDYKAMEAFLKNIAESYANITRLYSIGRSVQGRELYVMEITSNPGKHDPNKPEMKYIGNMHGNEVVGREVLLLLLKYMCENYGTDDRVTRIVNGVRLHVMPSMNPDGYEIAQVGDVSGVKGRSNAKKVDLNRDFPDQYGDMKVQIQPLVTYLLVFPIYGAFHAKSSRLMCQVCVKTSLAGVSDEKYHIKHYSPGKK